MSGVFTKLSNIDCSKHVEKKGGLSYLSWSWAWSTLMDNYPSSSYEFLPEQKQDDGTVTVFCRVTVEGVPREMWLPVMDNRNNAVKNPDARKISDSKMRCLVKAIAMHGLGLYIYAGEDLPAGEAQEEPKATKEQVDEMDRLIRETDSDISKFLVAMGANTINELTQAQAVRGISLLETKLKKQKQEQ